MGVERRAVKKREKHVGSCRTIYMEFPLKMSVVFLCDFDLSDRMY